MPEAFHNEQSVVVDGETFRLVINFKAIDATEQLLKPQGYSGYDQILAAIQKPNAPVGLMGKVLWGLLREHHPDMPFDEILTLLFDKNGLTVGLALSQLLAAAFPEKEKGKNPRQPRGASKPS